MVDEGRRYGYSKTTVSKKFWIISSIIFAVSLIAIQWVSSFVTGNLLQQMFFRNDYSDTLWILYMITRAAINGFLLYFIFFAGLKVCGLISGIAVISLLEVIGIIFPYWGFGTLGLRFMGLHTIFNATGLIILFVVWFVAGKNTFRIKNLKKDIYTLAIALGGMYLVQNIWDFIRMRQWLGEIPSMYFLIYVIPPIFGIIGGALGITIASRIRRA